MKCLFLKLLRESVRSIRLDCSYLRAGHGAVQQPRRSRGSIRTDRNTYGDYKKTRTLGGVPGHCLERSGIGEDRPFRGNWWMVHGSDSSRRTESLPSIRDHAVSWPWPPCRLKHLWRPCRQKPPYRTRYRFWRWKAARHSLPLPLPLHLLLSRFRFPRALR